MTLPRLRTLLFLASLLLTAAPASALPTLGQDGTVFFESKIRPLLIEHCYKCHSEQEGEQKGGLLLDRESGWLEGGEMGKAVVPGNLQGSLLVHAIRREDEDTAMPPKEALPDSAIALLEEWIQMGAPGPKDDMGETEFSQLGDQTAIFEKAATHWAFQPVTTPTPPKASDPAWNENPVDQFVFAKLQENGLTPSAPAPAKILQRRLAYDLTGLPPAPQSTIQNPQSEIDTLVASPAFGEHFARLWLDVARYADTASSYRADTKTPHYYPYAFTYRDYVIDAFNADKPYDQFIREQLAADLMGLHNRAPELAALGFISISPLLASNDDFADDVIDTTTRGFLGLSVSCARCHDHKFEPVPTADYYALHGVFRSINRPRPWDRTAMPALDLYDVPAEILEDYQQKQKAITAKINEAKGNGSKLKANNRSKAQMIEETELAELLTYHPGATGRAMIVLEDKKPSDSYIFLRGESSQRGELVPRRFLKVLDPEQAPFPADNSGRLALAKKIASRDNPLTARVFVNRIWGALIGSHLVDTPSDFGLQGSLPTHPELLDWLAADFMNHDWSLKHLVRTIVTSRTYQQSSQSRPELTEVDPANTLLGRAHIKRLSIEEIRDSVLALSGQLETGLHSHAEDLWSEDYSRRRAVYGFINRFNMDPTLRAFDFPAPTATAEKRTENIVPQQALFTMNSPFIIDQSTALVEDLQLTDGMTEAARIDSIYDRIYQHPPSAIENERLIKFIDLMRQRDADPWPLLAQSLLMSNEFLFVD